MGYPGWLRRARVSARTFEQRVGFYESRLSAWGTVAVDAEQVAAYLDGYDNPNTRRTYYDNLRSIFTWALWCGQIETDPLEGVGRPPTPKPRPRPLSRDEAARVLAGATGDLRAQIMLGRYAGLRAHEIAKFSGEDIDADCLYVFGKGGKAAVIPTHPALWDLAQQYPRQGFWFPSDRTETGHVARTSVTNRMTRHFRALRLWLPLQIELLQQDYNTIGSFTAAALLTLMAILTLFLKSVVQWRLENQEKRQHQEGNHEH